MATLNIKGFPEDLYRILKCAVEATVPKKKSILELQDWERITGKILIYQDMSLWNVTLGNNRRASLKVL